MNESVPKITLNDTIFFYWTAISISVISNHNSFRVPFDKIASVYFIWKMYLYFGIGNGQPRNRHGANCIGTLSFPIHTHFIVSCRQVESQTPHTLFNRSLCWSSSDQNADAGCCAPAPAADVDRKAAAVDGTDRRPLHRLCSARSGQGQ